MSNVVIRNIVFYCPLRLVTLEAFQELVDWYKDHTFEALAQSQDNPETTLMFLDLVSSEDLDNGYSWNEIEDINKFRISFCRFGNNRKKHQGFR